jgi:hypothetical protein
VRSAVYFAAVAIVAAMTIRHDFARFLPDHLATEIGHNREALGLALLLVPIIQWFRPWAARQRYPMLLAVILAVALYAFGWWMLHKSGWTSDYYTFSESFFGAAFITVFIQPKRPARWAVWVTPAVLVFIVIFFQAGWDLDQSEDLVMILIAPLAFDLFDRRILDRSAPDRPDLRAGWVVSLMVAWFVLWRLAKVVRPDLHGPFDHTVDYGYRAAEAYWGIWLVHVYFSYWLGRSWLDRKPNAADPATGLDSTAAVPVSS